MRLIIIFLLINSFIIYCNQKVTNDTSNEDDDNDLIEQIINNLDGFFSELIEEIDFDNEIIIDEILDNDIFNIEDIQSENEYEFEDDLDDEESIWPERPIPRYKNIV